MNAIRLRTKLGCGFNQCLQNQLQIERRAADHLEHVGGRGLLLQRLGEVAGARLHLVEQAHVLDRDHGLIGEGLDECDLALRERAGVGRAKTKTPITLFSRKSGTARFAR